MKRGLKAQPCPAAEALSVFCFKESIRETFLAEIKVHRLCFLNAETLWEGPNTVVNTQIVEFWAVLYFLYIYDLVIMIKDSTCVWALCYSRRFGSMLIFPSVLLLKTVNLIMRMNEGNSAEVFSFYWLFFLLRFFVIIFLCWHLCILISILFFSDFYDYIYNTISSLLPAWFVWTFLWTLSYPSYFLFQRGINVNIYAPSLEALKAELDEALGSLNRWM